MTKVLTLEARNIGKLSDIKFDLEGHHLYIVGGKTDQGKTTALNTLKVLLCGRSGMSDYPDVLLQNGQNEGWIKAKLGDLPEDIFEPGYLTVELYLRRERGGTVCEQFAIKDSSGCEAPEPRTLLKRMFQLRGFDPLNFEKMKPAERKELMERLLGLDFTKEREQYRALTEERKAANKLVANSKARLQRLPHHSGVTEQSVSDLLAQIDQKQAVNDANQRQRDELKKQQKSLDDASVKAAEVRETIKQLQEKLKKATIDLQLAEAAIETGTRKAAEAQVAVDALKDEDVAALRSKLSTIESDNAKARENKQREDCLKELQDAEADAQSLNEQMDTLVAEQKRRMVEAKFPVQGMSLDDKGVLLNGLPFEQASRRQRIMASVDVGIALNPELRLLICEDGSSLDDESITALDAKLQEHNFQMLVEVVARRPADEEVCSVVISEGKVSKENKKKSKT